MAPRYSYELDREEASHEKRLATATGCQSLYQYETLSEDEPQIRLLTLLPGSAQEPIKGHLASYELHGLLDHEGVHQWEALSYCWGDSTEPRPLFIAGKVLIVTENLYIALNYLRIDKPRIIWIDQICVNQKDLNERNQQVQHMKLIYKNATHVIAWLGEGSSNSKIYMDMLCMVKSLMEQGLYPPTTKPTMQQEALLFTTLASDPAFKERKATLESSDDQDRQYLASLCNEFCNNPWFERVWIVQEAVLAEYLILQYGSVTVDWNVHSSCCLNLLWSDLVSQNLSGSGISLTDTIHMLTDEHFPPLRKELFSLVNALKYQRATDAKDRVYAIQGLVKPKPSRGKSFTSTLHIDYTKTAAQLSKDFALWHIENEGTLDVLSVCCEATTSAGLPTWTIDLDRGHSYCDRIFSCELRTLEMYCAGMRRAIQSQYISSIDGLILAGIEFDRIEEVSTRLHSRELCAVPKTDTWSEWRNLALRGQTEDPYDDMEGRTEAFWRTMIANQMWDDEELKYVKAPSRLGDQFHRWSSHEDLDSAADARRIGRALGESGSYDFINNLLVGNQAQLFRTQGGYLGLACEHVRPDDKIVILWGGRLPFLLRECKTKREIDLAESWLSTPAILHSNSGQKVLSLH